MLFGSEMNLLGYDGQGAGVFSAGTNQEYNKFLYDRNYVIAIRYKQVYQSLAGYNYSSEEMNQMMDKMRRIIVGMEPVTSIDAELTQEMKEKNRVEFGKASFDEVISSIEKTGELPTDDATKVQWEKATQLYDKRVDRLKHDDRFKLMVPYLLRETVFLRKIMTLDNVSFENYIDGLTKGNVGNLVKAISGQSEFFKKQFIMENIKEIIDENKIMNSSEWYRKYIEFDDALSEKKLGGRSIKERLDIVMSGKDKSWYWNLDHIFRENPTEIKALLHVKSLESLIKKYSKIIDENKKSIEECETYKKLKKQNMAYADQFVTSRQKEIVTMPNDLFKSSVESWAQEFEFLINNVELTVDNSALVLNARFCKEFDEKKQAGKELRSKQTNHVEMWHEQMWKQCSPYLVMKNNTDALSNKTIKKAKKEIREQYWDYSDIVQNLLAERTLANPKVDEVGIRMNAIFLERAWEKVEGIAKNSQDGMTMQRAQQFMIFLDLHANDRPNDEVEFTKVFDKLLAEFNKRQKLIDEFNIQLVFEKEGYDKIATQIKDIMSGLDNMGKYTMPDEEFEAFIENEHKYWMNVYTASQLIKKNLAYKEKSEDDLKGPIEFFLDYFSKEICDGTYVDVISSDNIVQLVKDPEFYKFVKNPESKIGRVSPLDYEKSSGIITHDDVIKLITDTKDEDVIQAYNALVLCQDLAQVKMRYSPD